MTTPSAPSERAFVHRRHIPVARDLIFRAFAEPERLARWWGPNGFTNTFHEFDFKPGGLWRHDMHGPDGKDYPNLSRFEAVSAERIELRHLETVHAFTLEVTLEPVGHGTDLVWRQTFDSAEEAARVRDYVPNCNEQVLDRLEAELAYLSAEAAGDRELRLVRIIDAPPAKVYRCWTAGELLVQWFTPPPWKTVSADLDVQRGGSQTIVMQGPDGTQMPMHGVYLEVVPDHRLVMTDAFVRAWEPSSKAFMTTELTFEDLGGRTRYTARVLHWSAEDRAQHEAMGFHQGWGTATDQLAALAATL